VATCCEIFDNVLVNWSGDHLYATEDKSNLWDVLFANNPAKGQLDFTRDNFELLTMYPDWHLTAQYVADHYLNKNDPWRQIYHQHWLGWQVRDELVAEAEAFTDAAFGNKPYIAVQIRASANHANEQITGNLQTIEQYEGAIRAALVVAKRDLGVVPRVFVAASDEETLQHFAKEFNAATYTKTRRSENRAHDFHVENPQTFEDAINCFVEVLIMSKAVALIHPASNMATAALYINPRMLSIYIP